MLIPDIRFRFCDRTLIMHPITVHSITAMHSNSREPTPPATPAAMIC